MITAALGFSAALFLRGQAPQNDDKAKTNAALKAKQIAQNFENNAQVLTLFDREGKVVGTVGERGLYNQPGLSPDRFSTIGERAPYFGAVLSPDRTRLAVPKLDQEAERSDLWVIDVATDRGTRLTQSAAQEFVDMPVWSPDSSEVAYVASRNGTEGVYRKAVSGEGPEELLYKNPGFGLNLTDWSSDGRFLSFAKSDLASGALYVLPLSGRGERVPIEIFRRESPLLEPRFSPDSRFVSYLLLNQAAGKAEIFVRPFDASGAMPATGPWQVAENSRGMSFWGRDGKELYYVGADRSVMVAQVSTSPTFTFEKPKVLFRPPGVIPAGIGSISRDGERFVGLPPPRVPQFQRISVFDREGKVVNRVGEPGLYSLPAFSPDGTRLAVMRKDPTSEQQDIWTFDIATGKGAAVTNDTQSKTPPLLWTRDGRHILYVSRRGSYSGIYQRTWDGAGDDELLFRYTPGAIVHLTDISADGKFLVFDSGGVILVVALTGNDPLARKAVEVSREEFSTFLGRLSPDGRFMAYLSNGVDSMTRDVYVRSFDSSTGTLGTEGKWRVSKDGVASMLSWRADGSEFFFRGLNRETNEVLVISADVSTAPTFQAGTPKLLFRLPGSQGVILGNNVSPDGRRFVFAIDEPAK
jgi:Tol biopolymer transport system component